MNTFKTSDKYTIFGLLWAIWSSVHSVVWLQVVLGLVSLAYFIAAIVESHKED